MKWGRTGATVAAAILADRISGRQPEPWAHRFNPHRLSFRSTPRLAKINAKTGTDLVVDRITPAESVQSRDVPADQARVLRAGLAKVGAYREPDGTLHAVSLRCTQLGACCASTAPSAAGTAPATAHVPISTAQCSKAGS